MAQTPAFEAASIKLSGANSVRGWEGGPGTSDPGQYTFGRATIMDLIAQAYGVGFFQISSPIALDEQRFDVIAKVPSGATKEQFHLMMQAMLAERFHLKVHTTSKEFPAFDLAVAKGGPRFKEADGTNSASPGLSSRQSFSKGFVVVHLRGDGVTMTALASFLPRGGEPPVGDTTGLTGKYDFNLDYTIEVASPTGADAQPEAPPAPDLAVALRDQLGLQLVRKRTVFDLIVVDSVDKLPTQN